MGIGTIIGWAVFGLIAGAVARLLHPGRDPMNWLWTMGLGIAGALIGGWIGQAVGIDAEEGLWSWIAAIAGAVLLLVAYNALTGPRARAAAGPATTEDYKRAVYDDLSRGPNG